MYKEDACLNIQNDNEITISAFFPNIISMFSQSATTIFLFYTFIPTYSKTIGGILFGIAFWAAARNLGHKSIVKDYMTIPACGLVLLFVSNQGILLIGDVPYPPFGLVTVSFIGLSSYMVLVGISAQPFLFLKTQNCVNQFEILP